VHGGRRPLNAMILLLCSTALAGTATSRAASSRREPDGATSCAVRCDGRVTHRACAPRPRTHARRDARVRRTYQRCADPLACLAPEDAPCSLLVCRLPARFCWCLLATVACCDRRCQGVATFLRSHSIGRIALETRVVSALSPAAAVHAALRLPPLCGALSPRCLGALRWLRCLRCGWLCVASDLARR
jgi:hypothetical protein